MMPNVDPNPNSNPNPNLKDSLYTMLRLEKELEQFQGVLNALSCRPNPDPKLIFFPGKGRQIDPETGQPKQPQVSSKDSMVSAQVLPLGLQARLYQPQHHSRAGRIIQQMQQREYSDADIVAVIKACSCSCMSM